MLTSREIAKLVTGQLGTLTEFCDVEEIETALDFIAEHRKAIADSLRVLAEQKAKMQSEFTNALKQKGIVN